MSVKAAAARPSAQRDARATVRAAQRVSGHPIAPAARARLEARFGHDLGALRVHTDDLAAAAARELDAHAFTVGRDIFFARGSYRPGTPDGDALLEHEIAHALAAPRASNAGAVAAGTVTASDETATTTSAPGDAVERNADAATAALRAGRTPVVGAVRESDVRFARAAAGLALRPADAQDPAQVVESLVQSVLRALRADANDSSGAVRGQLTRFDERTRRLVLDALHARMVSDDWHHLIDVLTQPLPEGTEQGTQPESTPEAAAGEGQGTAAEAAAAEGAAAAAARPGEAVPGEPVAGQPSAGAPGQQPAAAETEAGATPGEAQGAVDRPPLQGAEAPQPAEAEGAPAAGAAGPGRAAEAPGAVPDMTVAEAPMDGGAGTAETVAIRGPRGEREPAPGASAGPSAGAAEPGAAASGAMEAGVPPEAAAMPPGADAGGPDRAGPEPAGPEPASAPPAGTSAAAAGPTGEPPSSTPESAVPQTAEPRPDGARAAETPAGETSVGEPQAGDASAASDLPGPAVSSSAEASTDSPAAGGELEPAVTETAAAASATDPAAPAGPAPAAPGSATPTTATQQSAEATSPAGPAGPAGSGAAATEGDPVVDLGPVPSGDDDAIGRLGGGGGGSALPDPPQREVAVPAGAAPAAALATAAAGTPTAIARSLGAVHAAVGRDAQRDRGALAATPPALDRPTGAPHGLAVHDPAAPAVMPGAARRPAVPSGNAAAGTTAVPAVAPVTAPLPPVPAPAVTANAEGQVTAADAQRLAQSVDELPTTDPALQQATAGDAPSVALEGDADPALADEHRTALATTTANTAEAGAADAAAPLGEDGIAPTVPDETLRAQIPAGDAAAGGPGGAGMPDVEPTDPTAIIAEQQSGDTVRDAAQSGAQGLTAQSEQQAQQAADARTETAHDADTAVDENAEEQRVARDRTQTAVRRQRGEWTAAQHDAVRDAQSQGDEEVQTARGVATEQRRRGDDEARTHVGEGNRRIADARTSAEQRARSERDRARNESSQGGFFSRLASAVTSFFSELRNAIHAAFERARTLVTEAIQWAQRAAAEAITRARDAVVAGLRFAAERMTQISDVLLAAFPAARDRFRRAIRETVEAAIATVDRFANALKAGVQRLLNALGRRLLELLAAAERAANELLASVERSVQGAIRQAQSFIASAAAFAALIRDIARSPGQWISNLGAAIVDGLRNHLWTALKAAVKEWFNSKVEQVVGIGRMIFDVLRRGGIQFGRIAAMVWAAVKAAIPRAIVEFLVSRLVAMLVPALGAIMAIVDGLRAAWATVQRIIAAFERFMAFLRAVKNGNAGPLFAQALAAAAVAVIDFTANFILSKIARGASGVGNRLRGIATRIMAFLRRGVAAVRRVVARVGRAIVAAARWVGRQARRLGRWIANSPVGRALARGARWIANTRVGRFIARQYQRVRAAIGRARERFRAWRERRRAASAQGNADRLNNAVTAIRPRLHAMLRNGVAGARLRLTLLAWRAYYRIRRLDVAGTDVIAANSPPQTVLSFVRYNSEELFAIIRRIGYQLMNDPRVTAAEQGLQQQRAAGRGTVQSPLQLSGGTQLLGGARDLQQRMIDPARSGGRRVERMTIGDTGQVFHEAQWARSAGGVITGTIGNYPRVQTAWNAMAQDTGMNQAQLATHLQGFIRTGQVGTVGPGQTAFTAAHRRQFGELARLMVSVEGGRSPSALVEAPMLLSLMRDPTMQARGEVSAASVFGTGTAAQPSLNPVTMVGAYQGQRSADFQNILDAPLDPATTQRGRTVQTNSAQARQARINLLATFIHRQMELTGESFDTAADVERFVQREFETLLRSHIAQTYGVDLSAAPTGLLYGARGEVLTGTR